MTKHMNHNAIRPIQAINRRQLLRSAAAQLALGAGVGCGLGPHNAAWAQLSTDGLVFPRDLGSHNNFDIEWWYLTGYVEVAGSATPLGLQVTFFRKRIASNAELTQQLAAKHLVFAHAALAIPPGADGYTGQLRHSQRTARWNGHTQRPSNVQVTDNRAYPGAWASTELMDVGIANADGTWHMSSTTDKQFTANAHSTGDHKNGIHTGGFNVSVLASASQPPILQGNKGLSQKGPAQRDTSWYTTHPQLQLRAKLDIDGVSHALTGRGWLDHEWSHGFMPEGAAGWDWVGFNFDDGTALTAFQLRDTQQQTLWAGGSHRTVQGQLRTYKPADVVFIPGDMWQSPRTGIKYPVGWRLNTPLGAFDVQPVMPDQELDSRQSTGTVYWEGLCGLHNAQGHRVAWGYLEMTGYGQSIRL